jgi:hypothetical protein
MYPIDTQVKNRVYKRINNDLEEQGQDKIILYCFKVIYSKVLKN